MEGDLPKIMICFKMDVAMEKAITGPALHQYNYNYIAIVDTPMVRHPRRLVMAHGAPGARGLR